MLILKQEAIMFEAKYDQFIGQYPNLFSDELCDTYIKWLLKIVLNNQVK